MYDIVAIGELLIDFTSQGNALYTANPGGAPANFAAAAAADGARTALIAKVGDDVFGRQLKSSLSEAGVDVSGVISDPDVFTTLAFVSLDAKGERSFSFARKPGADTCLRFSEIPPAMLKQTRVLHFGSLSFTDEPSRAAVMAAVSCAKSEGALITYDPNYRPALWDSEDPAVEAIKWGLSAADVVKLSEEEAFLVTGEKEAKAAAASILNGYDCRLVFLSRGENGCYYMNAACSGSIPALTGISVKDTTGAGDIFGGTAISRLLSLETPPEALTEVQIRQICAYACTAAGLSVQKEGGIPSIPKKEKTQNIFSQNYGNVSDCML